MDAAASINWATPASTVLFAGQQLHWTTQGDTHMSAAYTVSSVAAEAANLYAHEGGIQAIAGNGPVSLQAHTDQLEILADKEVVVISVNDSIEIKAKQKIVLQAGQSSITLEGANITFACPGEFSVKGGQHIFDAGAHAGKTPAPLPDGLVSVPNAFSEQKESHSLRFAFPGSDEVVDAFGLIGTPFAVTKTDGTILASGKIDETGRLPRLDFNERTELVLHLGADDWRRLNVDLDAEDLALGEEADDVDAGGEERDDGDPYGAALGIDDEAHLASAFLAKFIDNPGGEE
jgi:type VI secretion system secreted protein VgrG